MGIIFCDATKTAINDCRRDEEIFSRPLGDNVGFLEGNRLPLPQPSKLLFAAGTFPIIIYRYGSASLDSNSSDCGKLSR
jgi:hypothetical protein